MSQILNPSAGGGGGGGVTSVEGTAPIEVNGVSGAPQVGAVVISTSQLDLHISKYIVSIGGSADGANYTTIQSALDAANLDGGGAIWVMPGTYTEDLLLYDATQIIGANANSFIPSGGTSITLIGTHTPPPTGSFSIRNVFLSSTTDIFFSAVAGDAIILIDSCNVSVDNGYTFNLPNWVGTMAKTLVENSSINNGIVFNTGGGFVYIQNSNNSTPGSTNVMTTSGPVIIKKTEINAPILFDTGTNFFIDRCIFNNSITFGGDSAGEMEFCHINNTGNPCIIMSSSGSCLIINSSFNTNNNPAVDGLGVGTLTLNEDTFINDTNIAATLTIANTGGLYPAGDMSTPKYVLTSNGTGVCPTFQEIPSFIFLPPVDVDTTTLGVTQIFTFDREFIVTAVYALIVNLTGVQTAPLGSLGSNGPAFDNITNTFAFTSGVTDDYSAGYLQTGIPSKVMQIGDILTMNVIANDTTATTDTQRIYIFGYYI